MVRSGHRLDIPGLNYLDNNSKVYNLLFCKVMLNIFYLISFLYKNYKLKKY